MIKKVKEVNLSGEFIKNYSCDEDFSDFINQLDLELLDVNEVRVTEDADLGMKTFDGTYNLEDFWGVYRKHWFSIKNIQISLPTLSSRIVMFMDDNIIALWTPHQELELENLIKKDKAQKRPDDLCIEGVAKLCAQGDTAYKKGRIDAAINYYREALKLEPDSGDIWRALGLCYRKNSRLNDARSCYTRSLEIKPNDPLTMGNLGVLEISCGNSREAYRCCKYAYETGTGDADTDAIFTANFAVATAMIGNKTEAYRILEDAKQKGYNDYTVAKQIIANQ